MDFAQVASAIYKLRLAKLSSVGAPQNEPGNKGAIGLPRARAPHSHGSLSGEIGGAPPCF